MKVEAYVFAFKRPDEQWGAVCDKNKRLIVTLSLALAQTFEVALSRRLGRHIVAVTRNPVEVAALVVSRHVSATDIAPHLAFLESDDCTDAEDAIWRAIDVANAIPADTVGDWHATHPERVTT